jgi:hypothetical protein
MEVKPNFILQDGNDDDGAKYENEEYFNNKNGKTEN